jgi:hypothetical protein
MIAHQTLVLSFSFILPFSDLSINKFQITENRNNPPAIKTIWDRAGSLIEPDIITNDDLTQGMGKFKL